MRNQLKGFEYTGFICSYFIVLKGKNELAGRSKKEDFFRMRLHQRFFQIAVIAVVSLQLTKADDLSDLKTQLQALQQQMNRLQAKIEKATDTKPQASLANPAVPAQPFVASKDQSAANKHGFFERKPGPALTFYTTNGEITPYGNIDLSIDAVTKGLGGKVGPDGFGPVGNMSWLSDISSNISYAGVRGFQRLNWMGLKLVYQLESQIDVASMPGTSESNSSESNVVKGALTSRNSFIGLSSSTWGAIKIGKTDAPYKNSTMRMNPFYGELGDYQVIMSNTGGDNRVEFGTRLDHSIWYESPNWKGVAIAALFSPGQNRALNSDNIAAGEADCTGGNIPGSGGITPITCSDGSFSNAASASVTFTHGPFYAAVAYERHEKVNRQSDIAGLYGSPNATEAHLEAEDVADEDAGKVGVQYLFPTKTTLSGIYETMHRYVPSDLEFQNERQRQGTWLALSQQLTKHTNINLGWAHAFRAEGDPGQHDSSFQTPPGGTPGSDSTGGANVNNQANMFTIAYKYQATKNLGIYTDWAMTMNGPYAHYDLGAGGRTVATDCHDAYAATGGLGSDPHCWAGGRLNGASLGMDWKF